MKEIQRMKELIAVIKRHNYNYYVLDNPTISDKEYDDLYYELVDLEKATGTILPDSPTQQVGDGVLKGFRKHTHEKPLYSLDKRNTYDELREWMVSILDEYGKQKFTLEYKYDGLRVVVTYEDGIVVNAATRGNGFVGEDVTAQILTVKSLPKQIPYKGKVIVMGEAMMRLSVLNEYNRSAAEPLKNARNAAAGAIRNLDINITRSRNIDIFFYDILSISSKEYSTQQGMHEFLKKNGFLTDYFEVIDSADELLDKVHNIDKNKNNLDILLDGAVVKLDDLALREEIGFTAKFPKWAVAFKFEAQELTSMLKNIVWQVGRTGKLTPIGEIEPIELAGATVKRATLNNYGDILRKGVKINSRVFVRRSNEVIPEILGVAEVYDSSREIVMPTHCPCCGHDLIEEGANLFCHNKFHCEEQVIDKLTHFASRNAMNIEGLNEKTLKLMYKEFGVNSIEKLYEVTKEQLLSLEGFKDKKAQNIIDSIEKSKHCNLSNFVYALGILNVGQKTAKDLANTFGTLQGIMDADFGQLIAINDVGDVIANCIIDYFDNDYNMQLINRLFELGVKVNEQVNTSKFHPELTGKNVVLTGTLPTYTRDQAKEILESFGANVVSSVSKNTDLVLLGDNAGSKLAKAQALNIKLIDEKQFNDLINNV